jgi:hypothetical protein
VGGAGELHAAFLNESRTRGRVLCCDRDVILLPKRTRGFHNLLCRLPVLRQPLQSGEAIEQLRPESGK